MNTAENRIDQSVNFSTTTTNMNNQINILTDSRAEELKSSLVKKLSAEYAGVGPRLVYQAVNEAYALASTNFAPLLLLPVLAEEKVQQAAAWSAHQRAILHALPGTAAARRGAAFDRQPEPMPQMIMKFLQAAVPGACIHSSHS